MGTRVRKLKQQLRGIDSLLQDCKTLEGKDQLADCIILKFTLYNCNAKRSNSHSLKDMTETVGAICAKQIKNSCTCSSIPTEVTKTDIYTNLSASCLMKE